MILSIVPLSIIFVRWLIVVSRKSLGALVPFTVAFLLLFDVKQIGDFGGYGSVVGTGKNVLFPILENI